MNHWKKSTFCSLPWLSISHTTDGFYRLCCGSKISPLKVSDYTLDDAWKSEYFNSIRKSMLVGEEISDCKNCYEEEEMGFKSRRQSKNEKWKCDLDKQYEKTEISSQLTKEQKLVDLDLKIGNLCNQMCRTCDPSASILIEKEGVIPSRRSSEDVTSDFSYFANNSYSRDVYELLPNIKSLYLTGGEPSINPEVQDLLDHCIEQGFSNEIELKFYTNLKLLPKSFIKRVSKFKKVIWGCSIDAFAERNDYLRHPSNWDDSVKNFETIIQIARSRGDEVMVNCTVSWFNIYYFEELLDWLNKKIKTTEYPLQVYLTPLHHPGYLSLINLPQDIATEVQVRFEHLLTHMKKSYSHLFAVNSGLIQNLMGLDAMLKVAKGGGKKINKVKKFLFMTDQLDKARGQSFARTFPEFSKRLDSLCDEANMVKPAGETLASGE